MISRLSPTLNKFVAKARVWQGKDFYETKQGFKYAISGYDSSRFPNHVKKVTWLKDLSQSFDDLIMPPDALKNRYSWAGKSITESPHLRLMRDLDMGSLTMSSEYVQLCLAGTLDARRPFKPNLRKLRRLFAERVDELASDRHFDVFVMQPAGAERFIIADGKHRAALAAYLGADHAIRINFISSVPYRQPFFIGLYSQILNASDQEYSNNQSLIRLMVENE